ncbi:MAG: adenylate/guanylate cyclase domain-containing protein [Alphaproteobacteria bacterium]|nr:adenylate/guanylate cyclase domain-containing protein [Alphaproteobacteria bacterium]
MERLKAFTGWLRRRLGNAALSSAVIAALITLSVALRIADPAPIAKLRLASFDTFLQLSPRQADPAFPVKVVAIDEASLKVLGQWPWPRNILARLVNRLSQAGAKAIAFDIILPEADRLSPQQFAEAYSGEPQFGDIAPVLGRLPTLDQRLSKALAEAPSVLAFAGDNGAEGWPGKVHASFAKAGDAPEQFVPFFAGSVANVAGLADGVKGLGAANWIPEGDQIVRRVPLLINVAGALYPSLSLEALRVAEGWSTIFIKSSGGSGAGAFGQQTGIEVMRAGESILPTNPRGELWLRLSATDPRRTIPAHRVLAAGFDPASVAGKIVFIGATAIGLLDIQATPLDDAVPGVEMHAQAVEQILAGDHAVRPAYAPGLEIVFLVGMGGLTAWLLGRSGPILAAAIGIAAIAAVAVGCFQAYRASGLLIDPVYPSLSLAFIYAAGSLTNFVRSENERRQVRSAFANYLAPELVEELVAHPEKLKLGGESREVTLLFADVRGFSGIAEGLSAEELVAFVNRLFTPLSEAIIAEGGTIDKFMGDAVMAFWNAPLADPRHGEHACRAALRMLDQLDELNAQLASEAQSSGRVFKPVQIGVGLNTGDACVGNVGCPGRFDYSVLGDVVNVASRLEALTKSYGVAIIVGEATARSAPNLAFIEIDKVVPRGRSQPEAIFALLGDESVAQGLQFRQLQDAHRHFYSAMKSGKREEALAALEDCRAIGLAAYRPLLQSYSAKLKEGAAKHTSPQ